jgi:hypothetical protein
MANKMNTTEMQSIMTVLESIESKLDTFLSNSSSPSTKETKKTARKPRDPDAPKSAWIVFTGKVREALKDAGKPAGKECQQFASFLKTEFPNAYEMESSEILAAHESWVPPPPKPKGEMEEKVKSESEEKPKPKRTLSDEQKAKMAAGRKTAAERKKAEKEAAQHQDEEAEEAPAPAPAPKAKPTVKATPSLRPLPLKGKRYLWDSESNGLWMMEADKSKGAWAGILTKEKTIDTSAKDYTA